MIEEVGDGSKTKVIITERRWGRMTWIRFGVEGAKTFLKSVVELRTEADKNFEGLGWCENGRRYSLEMRKNHYGRFLLCSVKDLDGRKHRLIFPEGNGMLNGWIMLEGALQDLGFKEDRGERRKITKTSSIDKAENQKGGLQSDTAMEIKIQGRRRKETIWLNTSECCPKGDLRMLKHGIVGSWKTMPDIAQSLVEVENWVKRAWQLEGRIAIHTLNHKMFFMGFELPEEARWVMEKGSRMCRGGVLQLEWWTPYSGCNGLRDQKNEVWIRVVGLPLHLWTGDTLKKVGDYCGGFVALDEGTSSKTDLLWARILVKVNSKVKPTSVILSTRARSYEVQIWWEIQPTVVEVSPRNSRNLGGLPGSREEDVRCARAIGRVNIGRVVKYHNYRGGLRKVGDRTVLGRGAAGGRLSSNRSSGKSENERTKLSFKIQNEVEIKGREGEPKQLLMDSDRVGPHLTGGSAHVSGQKQEVFEGPSEVRNGEQSKRPSKRPSPATMREACMGRIGGTTSVANPSRSWSQEREARAAEEKGTQETISLQGQGCSDVGEDENYCVSEKESPSGNFLDKLPFGAKQELDGEKDGSTLGAVDMDCNDRRDDTQDEEKVKQWSRDSGLKLACLRAEEEGEVDKRTGRSVESHGEELGKTDEGWVTTSGRVHHYRKGEEAEKLTMSGQSIEEGRESGQGLDSNSDTCRVYGSSSGSGQKCRATQSPVSFNRASNGTTIHEPTYFKAQTEILKTGLVQDLVSKAVEMAGQLEPISGGTEAGQERMTSALGGENELSEAAGQAEGHDSKIRYDNNPFSQSTPIPFSVFGRPLLLGGNSGLGESLMENALPIRVVAADGKEWGPESSYGIIDEVEATGAGKYREEGQCESVEHWNYGSWESSCLVKFSEFLGFSTKGFEKEILKLLRNLVDSQNLSKEKGSLTVSKSERELRRLRSTINYNGSRSNKGGGRDRGNLLLKLK